MKQKQNLEFAVEKKAGKEQSWKKKSMKETFFCALENLKLLP